MKKKVLILLIIIIFIFGGSVIFGYYNMNKNMEKPFVFDLNQIIPYLEKDDNYLSISKYYSLNTAVNDNQISISFSNNEHQGQLKGILEDDILSFQIKNSDDNSLLKAMMIYSIVDGLGQINGNEKGYVSAMITSINLEDATIEENGIELISEDEINTYKFKVNRKFELGDINNNYFKMEDIQEYKESFTSDTFIQTTKGNLILYKDTDFYKKNIIYLCEADHITIRTYNSLLNIIELLYGKDYRENFAKAYPKIDTASVLNKFDIVVNYQPKEKEVVKDIITDNYKILKITIKN